MRKSITTMLSIMIFALAFVSTDLYSADRVAVLEDHTGAWCGWCPRGTYIGEELLAEHGIENFIMIAVHNNDAMATPYQGTLASAIGLQGYPGGSVNRKAFSGMTAPYQGTNTWEQTSNIAMGETAPLGVEIEWTLDDSGNIEATVTANVDADHSKQLAFNVFVIEDGLTGSGQGWDQANYLSGNSQYSDYPYYDMPNPITGFVHDNVLIEMLGGQWGDASEFPATVSAGDTYTQTFQGNISSQMTNKSNVWVVGIVQEYQPAGSMEIVNAKADGKRIVPKVKPEVTAAGNPYNSNTDGETITNDFTISNPSDFEITVDLSINADNSVIPQGWMASVDPMQVTIPANGSANTTVTLVAGSGAGFAMVTLDAVPQSGEEFAGLSNSAEMYSLAEATEVGVFVGYSNSAGALLQALVNNADYGPKTAFLPANEAVLANYSDNFELAVFEFDYFNGTSGPLVDNGSNARAIRKFVDDMLAEGKNAIISSQLQLVYAGNTQNGLTEANNWYQNTLGIRSNTANPAVITVSTNSQGQITGYNTFGITGSNESPVAAGMKFTAQNNQNISNIYREQILIGNPAIATPMFIADTDQSIAGVSVETPAGGKAIYVGFSIATLPTNDLNDFVSRAKEFFDGASAGAPVMTLSSSFENFGKYTDTAIEKTISITNDGTATLNITDVSISQTQDVFSIVSYPTSLEPDASGEMVISFNPSQTKGGQFGGTVTIVTNANPSTQTINVVGSMDVTSIYDNYLTRNGLLEMTVAPNPVVSTSNINLELGVDAAEDLSLVLIDAAGNTVMNVFNGSVVAGNKVLSLDAAELASGKYFLIATMKGHKAQYPVVISK